MEFKGRAKELDLAVHNLAVPLERKLAGILYADVADYSRLTEQAEERTHILLSEALDLITRNIEQCGGKVEHYAGDAVLAEFPGVARAVTCALTTQDQLARGHKELPESQRVSFRIGINLGEVIVDRGEIYGEEVNVAARLESLAEPGTVWVSDVVRQELRGKLPVDYVDMGEHRVKNIAEPLRAFRATERPGAKLPLAPAPALARKPRAARFVLALVSFALALVALSLLWLAPKVSDKDISLALPEKPSLAVLPFHNLNRDPAQDYFVDGLTDDLITDLSKNEGLFVIARGSSSLYKNATLDIQDIAGTLGVQYIVTGSLRRMPSVLRVNAQLIDARSGATLWADRYDADLVEILDLQEVIVNEVLAALPLSNDVADHPSQRVEKTINLQAYDLFLQGWAHYQRETPEGYADAIPLLLASVQHDASFQRPHAVLAAIYYFGRLQRWYLEWQLSSHETFRLAYQHLQLATDQPSALGMSISAMMHIHNGRHGQAIADAENAIDLDPNDPTGQIVLTEALSMAGRAQDAFQHAAHAMRLNPHYPATYPWTLGLAHFVAGEYELARSRFEQAGVAQAGLDLAPVLATYAFLGETERTAELADLQRARWRQWHPGHPMTVRSLVAEFPPFLRKADEERLREGLTLAIAPLAGSAEQH